MIPFFQNKYDSLRQRLSTEIVEPSWGWGFRVGISVLLPALLSYFTGNHELFWMIVAAETVSIVELKGSSGMRMRLLIAAFVFTLLFTLIGSWAGNYLLLAGLLMFPIALSVGLMKNLGDWGPGLALNIYIFYLIATSHPVTSSLELMHRMEYVMLGGLWSIVVGVFSFSFLPQGQPYRRTIGKIWMAVESLATAVANDWDLKQKRSSVRSIYLKERAIRLAIDDSHRQFGVLYDSKKDQSAADKNLSYARRCAAMAGLQLVALADISSKLNKAELEPLFRTQMISFLKVLEQIANRMGYFLFTLKEEELLLLQSRLRRLDQFKQQMESMKDSGNSLSRDLFIHTSRYARLVQVSLDTLTEKKEQRIFRQYSLLQTLTILHPKFLIQNLRQFFNYDNLTLKYALRMAIAATVSYFLGSILTPHHQYWLPLTTIIVTQPFFGATLKKGIERSIGTVAGVLLGGLLMMLPNPIIVKYVLIFAGAVLMIYNLRRNYAWAAFFITLFLIGLMSSGVEIDSSVIFERVIATIAGGIIAIIAGFTLFPSWDKNLLPSYLSKAIEANFAYFNHLFYENKEEQKQYAWTKFKIAAEAANSNAYDSLNRYISEPKYGAKNQAASYFTAITYNIRITRELNFYLDEEESGDDIQKDSLDSSKLLVDIETLFGDITKLLQEKFQLPSKDAILERNKTIQHFPLSEQRRQGLERLYLELKALHAGLAQKGKEES